MYIEVNKKPNGKYEVVPNITPSSGGSPLEQTIEAFPSNYGGVILMDENKMPLKVEDSRTYDYSKVHYMFIPYEHSSHLAERGTGFNTLGWDDSNDCIEINDGDDHIYIDGYSTTQLTVEHMLLRES